MKDESLLLDSWKDFIHQTWEREEMRPIEKHSKVAFEIAKKVHPDDRSIFLQGTSVEDGGVQIIQDVLKKGLYGYEWLKPEPHFHRIAAPLFLTCCGALHGNC